MHIWNRIHCILQLNLCFHNILQFRILICVVLWSSVVWGKSENTTSTPTIVSTKSSAKIKRQYQYPYSRPPNYSPFVGDAAASNSAQRYADARAETINQVDQKDFNGNYNYA